MNSPECRCKSSFPHKLDPKRFEDTKHHVWAEQTQHIPEGPGDVSESWLCRVMLEQLTLSSQNEVRIPHIPQ